MPKTEKEIKEEEDLKGITAVDNLKKKIKERWQKITQDLKH